MLVFNALATGFNWLTLTASVSSVPLATLVILLPPLFRPDLVKDTGLAPLAMVRPSVVSTLSPAVTLGVVSPAEVRMLSPTVTLLNSTFSAVATVMFLPLRVTLMFLPSLMATSLSGLIFSDDASSLTFSFQPFSAVSFTELIASWMLPAPVLPMLLMVILPSSANFALPPNTSLTVLAVLPKTFCTAYSWLPLMASVDALEITPGATFFS